MGYVLPEAVDCSMFCSTYVTQNIVPATITGTDLDGYKKRGRANDTASPPLANGRCNAR